MTENDHPPENETEALKKRLGALEDFRNVGLLYGLVVGVVLVLVVVFFTLQNRQLSQQLSSIATSLDSASGTLQQAQQFSSNAAAQSGGSTEKMAALESMVGQAISAADEAAQAARSSLEASDQATQATATLRAQTERTDQIAAAAMQEALTAKTVADKNYARLQKFRPGNVAQAGEGEEEGGVVDVFVDGTNIKIWFREGAALSRNVRIEESHYSDVVLVPPGATATVRGSCNGCEFRVERKLKGRIEDQVSGSNNLFIEK